MIDQIKEVVSIVKIVGQYVKLKPVAPGKMTGLCPFHNEKSPSFFTNEDGNFFHCFGCGVGGDAMKFLQNYSNISFNEALKIVAQEAGIKLEEMEPEESSATETKETIYHLLKQASESFAAALFEEKYKFALNYAVKDRKLSLETIKHFSIGYAANNAIIGGIGKGYNPELLDSAGLVKIKDGVARDFFWDRLIIPIKNLTNQIVGFGGRILTNTKDAPKYLNSSENMVFSKGRMLFNFANAKKEILQHKTHFIVVEGYMDVIALYQFGFHTAVAPLGTAVTEMQLKLLFSSDKSPIFCMDKDVAGQNSMIKIAQMLLPKISADVMPTFLILQKHKDLDEMLNSYQNTKLASSNLQILLNKTMQMQEFLFTYHAATCNAANPNDIAKLSQTLSDIANKIINEHFRKEYHSFFRSRIANLRRGGSAIATVHEITKKTNEKLNNIQQIEIFSIAVLIAKPQLMADEEIIGNHMIDMSDDVDVIYQYFLQFISDNFSAILMGENCAEYDAKNTIKHLQTQNINHSAITMLSRLIDDIFSPQKTQISAVCNVNPRLYLKRNYVMHKLQMINQEILVVNKNENDVKKKIDNLIQQSRMLQAMVSDLDEQIDELFKSN
jgi:DNA primase catalytic core